MLINGKYVAYEQACPSADMVFDTLTSFTEPIDLFCALRIILINNVSVLTRPGAQRYSRRLFRLEATTTTTQTGGAISSTVLVSKLAGYG